MEDDYTWKDVNIPILSQIYVNLDQIEITYEDKPEYKFKVSTFWNEIKNKIDDSLLNYLEEDYKNKFINCGKLLLKDIERFAFCRKFHFLAYNNKIIPIPDDFLEKDYTTKLLKAGIQIIPDMLTVNSSNREYKENEPYFNRLTFTNIEITKDDMIFKFNHYANIFASIDPNSTELRDVYLHEFNDPWKKVVNETSIDSLCIVNMTFPSIIRKTEDVIFNMENNKKNELLYPADAVTFELAEEDVVGGADSDDAPAPAPAPAAPAPAQPPTTTADLMRYAVAAPATATATATLFVDHRVQISILFPVQFIIIGHQQAGETLMFLGGSVSQTETQRLHPFLIQREIQPQASLIFAEPQIDSLGLSQHSDQTSDPPAPATPAAPAIPAAPAAPEERDRVNDDVMNSPATLDDLKRLRKHFTISDDSPLANTTLSAVLPSGLSPADKARAGIILSEGRKVGEATKLIKIVEQCPVTIEETTIKKDKNGNETKMSSEIEKYHDGESYKKRKVIKVIFDHTNPLTEWITLKTYLYRLFIIDTLHDFFDKENIEKEGRLSALDDKTNKTAFMKFYQEYLGKFSNIFPEILRYDLVDSKYYDVNVKDQHETLSDLLKKDVNFEFLESYLNMILELAYHKNLMTDLEKEEADLHNFGDVLNTLEREKNKQGGYYAKTLIVDADKSSLQHFKLIHDYYNQEKRKKEQQNSKAPAPIIYLKTLSHELDQATTPKIEKVLRSVAEDYFNEGTITHLSSLKLKKSADCTNMKDELTPPGRMPQPEFENLGAAPAPAQNAVDDDDDDNALHGIQVQMIKRKQGQDVTFLDYQINRTFKETDQNVDLTHKEKCQFLFGLLHTYSQNIFNIRLRHTVLTTYPPSSRSSTRNSENKSHHCFQNWWSHRISTSNLYVDKSTTKKANKSICAFVVECMLFSKMRMDAIASTGAADEDPFRPSIFIISIIKLIYSSGNSVHFVRWRRDLVDKITHYITGWNEDFTHDNENIDEGRLPNIASRLINAINRIDINNDFIEGKKTEAVEHLSRMLKVMKDTSFQFDGHYNKYCDRINQHIDENFSIVRDNKSEISIDFKINKIFNDNYDTAPNKNWFLDMIGSIKNKARNRKVSDDDDLGTFGVRKLCDWMFNNYTESGPKRSKMTHSYDRLVKPVILKMVMDSFHYINLLENKLQVDNNNSVTIGKKVLPIMSTFDLNCGYLCGFFTDQILSLIENSCPSQGHRIQPFTIRHKEWKRLQNEQQNDDNSRRQRVASMSNQLSFTAGGSGKTRRRGDKIKSNGKITRRKQ